MKLAHICVDSILFLFQHKQVIKRIKACALTLYSELPFNTSEI
jgi:hypothetical protein